MSFQKFGRHLEQSPSTLIGTHEIMDLSDTGPFLTNRSNLIPAMHNEKLSEDAHAKISEYVSSHYSHFDFVMGGNKVAYSVLNVSDEHVRILTGFHGYGMKHPLEYEKPSYAGSRITSHTFSLDGELLDRGEGWNPIPFAFAWAAIRHFSIPSRAERDLWREYVSDKGTLVARNSSDNYAFIQDISDRVMVVENQSDFFFPAENTLHPVPTNEGTDGKISGLNKKDLLLQANYLGADALVDVKHPKGNYVDGALEAVAMTIV